MKFLVPKTPMVRPDYRGCRLPLNDMYRQSHVSFPQDSPSLGYSNDLMLMWLVSYPTFIDCMNKQ